MSEFVIAEAREAFRNDRRPYTAAIPTVERAAQSRASEKLAPLQSGGLVADEGEYATQTPRPRYFASNNPGGTQITAGSFRQNVPGTGWQTVLAADLSSGGSNIGTDWVLGIAGFRFLEPTQRYTELRILAGDKTLPVMNVEDAKQYEEAAILFKLGGGGEGGVSGSSEVQHFIYDEDTTFELQANFTSAQGSHYIKPVGTALVPQPTAISQSP